MGVTGILCSFRLVLEGKRVKRYLSHQHLSSLKSFCQKFHFIRCRGQHIRTLNNTISNSQVSGKSSALCFISIWKFGWLKNPSAKITNLSELYFRFRFILLVQKKKSDFYELWQHQYLWRWVRLLRWGIYTSIPTWTHSHNSLAAAEALTLKIPFHGISLNWSQRLSQSAKE